MSTTVVSTRARSRVDGARNTASSVPPPSTLTAAQRRELEAELRRELVALERRIVSEHQAASAETHIDANDVTVALRGTSDSALRRDAVASALARLASGGYGSCSRCGEPIPYGRLVVMPEATHCLRCSGRP